MSIGMNVARVASGAVIAGNRRFNVRPSPVFEFRLKSLGRTVTSGQTQFIMQSAAERNALLDRNKALGGSCPPIVLGVIFRIIQSVTIPACAGGNIAVAASVYERLADCTVNVSAGKAGMAYLMGRTDSIGLLMAHLKAVGGFTAQLKAVESFCADRQVTAARIHQNTDSGVVLSSLDNFANTDSRPLILEDGLRTVYNGNTGTSTPATGTQYADAFYFPLTADGTHGVSDAGISFDELFSADNQWIFNLNLQNNTGLYPNVTSGGAATTFGSFDVEVSLLYRVHVGAKTLGETPIDPSFGSVWQWNANVGTIPDGVAQNLAGELIKNHMFVGYLPTLAPAGKYTQLLDAATVPYEPSIRIIPLKLDPKQLNTDSVYVRVGDGVEFDMPPGGNDQLTRGNEILERWNGRYRFAADHDGFDPYHEGIEFQTFGDAGVRAASTTLVATTPSGSVSYDGAPIDTLEIYDSNDTTTVAGLGGLIGYPVAWSDRSASAGFASLAPRSSEDARPVQVTTVGGFNLPLLGDGSRAPVQCWRYMGPYSDFSGAGCDPCGHPNATPIVLRPGSENKELGKKMSVSFKVSAPTLEHGAMLSKPTVL